MKLSERIRKLDNPYMGGLAIEAAQLEAENASLTVELSEANRLLLAAAYKYLELGEENASLTEKVERLEKENEAVCVMLDNVLDANYGVAVHHIGDGDGLDDAQAEELRTYWHNRLQR